MADQILDIKKAQLNLIGNELVNYRLAPVRSSAARGDNEFRLPPGTNVLKALPWLGTDFPEYAASAQGQFCHAVKEVQSQSANQRWLAPYEFIEIQVRRDIRGQIGSAGISRGFLKLLLPRIQLCTLMPQSQHHCVHRQMLHLGTVSRRLVFQLVPVALRPRRQNLGGNMLDAEGIMLTQHLAASVKNMLQIFAVDGP
ncbi:hypothetical protein AAHB37_02870 [Glutamicibacter halophytocola]